MNSSRPIPAYLLSLGILLLVFCYGLLTSTDVFSDTVKSAGGHALVEHQQPLALSVGNSEFYLRAEPGQRISHEPDNQDRDPFAASSGNTRLCPGRSAVRLLSLRNTQLPSIPHYSQAVSHAPPVG